jgi:hypothetical protein
VPYITMFWCPCFKDVTVFAVRRVIRRLGCLNKFVTVRICGPKYVNVIHLLWKLIFLRVSNSCFIGFKLQRKTKEIPNYNNIFDSSEICSLTCASCNLNYVGQTGRSLKQRYSEHTRYIRYNDSQLAYANHILQHAHEFESIHNTLSL